MGKRRSGRSGLHTRSASISRMQSWYGCPARCFMGSRAMVSLLAPVLEAIKQLGRYTDAEIMAAVISAMFTVFIEPAGCFNKTSGGISRAAPICFIIACTKTSYPVLGCFGYRVCLERTGKNQPQPGTGGYSGGKAGGCQLVKRPPGGGVCCRKLL